METAEKIQECPVTACMELQEAWKSGKGAFDAGSKWCQKCTEEEPETANICKERTQTMRATKKEEKVAARKIGTTRAKTGSRGNANGYGHGISTQAGIIDAELIKGASVAEIMSAGGGSSARIKSHVAHLKTEHGVRISFVGGKYKIEKGE